MHLKEGTLLKGGTYRIIRFIASGGFGCTYEAEHLMLDKKVAIKEFFPKSFCNREADNSHITTGTESQKPLVGKLKKKFVDEARSIAKLSHNGIVKVTDVFEENGTAYYVMDYIEGKSLGEIILQRGPLQEKEALKYIHQVCEALAYVHDKNRLHLDIKPGNIMIDEEDNATLIDFGASKQYDEENGENTSTIVGKTPGFAPIEQMGNDVSRFKPATDVYSLGATLYKCLTGKTPLESNLLADGDELEELPSNISESTKKAVKAAMQVSSRKRPQSIREFVAILDSTTQNPDRKDNDSKAKDEVKEDTLIEISKQQEKAEKSESKGITDEETSITNPNKLNSLSENQSRTSFSSEEQTQITDEKVSTQQENTAISNFSNQESKPSQDLRKPSEENNKPFQDQTKHPYKDNKPSLDLDLSLPQEKKSSNLKVLIGVIGAIIILLMCILIVRGKMEEKQSYYYASDDEDLEEIEEVEAIKDDPKILVGEINGHQWVDLGLPSGIKWATSNIGASSPEEYGDYFSWGETSPKSTYYNYNCITTSQTNSELSEANIANTEGILNPSHDAASVNWGDPWRMPTLEEIEELVNNTTWEIATQNGVPGRLIKSNLYETSIFIPAAGYKYENQHRYEGERGYYWSSTPSEYNISGAYYLFFNPDEYNSNWLNRYEGRTVRAVTE